MYLVGTSSGVVIIFYDIIAAASTMTVSTSDSPDDDAAVVLAALLGDGSLGESPGDATNVAGNGAEGTIPSAMSATTPRLNFRFPARLAPAQIILSLEI